VLGQKPVLRRVLGEAVVALEIVQADIVLVNPFTRRDVAFGEADDLPEFSDRLALADRRHRHLVAFQDLFACREPGGTITLVHQVDGDDDVVLFMQADHARGGHGVVPCVISSEPKAREGDPVVCP
jgi:hypothetical protein